MEVQTRRSCQLEVFEEKEEEEGSHERGNGANNVVVVVVGGQVEGEEVRDVYGQVLCCMRSRGYDFRGIRAFAHHSFRHAQSEYAGEVVVHGVELPILIFSFLMMKVSL
jgi:hypothetical protein